MKKLIISFILIAALQNCFSQDSTYNYIDNTNGFCLSLPDGYHINKLKGTNAYDINNENMELFSVIHILHLSDFIQKKELGIVSNFDSLAKHEILELLSVSTHTSESEVCKQVDSLIELKSLNGFLYYIAYYKEVVTFHSGESNTYLVKPSYFVILPLIKDAIILIFDYASSDENILPLKHERKVLLDITNSINLEKKLN